MKEGQLVAGLDIGSAKITTVIGEISHTGAVDVIGEGTVPSEGIKRGAVVNLERTTVAIRRSLEAAERVAGVRVRDVYVGVPGVHARSVSSHGLAAVRGQEITQADVDRAIENAQAIPTEPHYEVLHVLPQEFTIDGQDGIKNPVGMHGVRLEADVHLVSAASGPLANLRRCAHEAGLNVRGFMLQSLAAGMATLDSGEQDQTVVVIDIGGGTTNVGVFVRGNLALSTSVPIGGDHVTSDLAQILRIPFEEAEKVKLRYGAALPELAEPDLTLEITSASGGLHVISAHELSRVIRPRMAEIYSLIREDIGELGPVELLASGVIVTGGGAQLRGAAELARERLRLPVRVGRPRGLGGLSDIADSPAHAAAAGLMLRAAEASVGGPVRRPEPDELPHREAPLRRESAPAPRREAAPRGADWSREGRPEPQREAPEGRAPARAPSVVAGGGQPAPARPPETAAPAPPQTRVTREAAPEEGKRSREGVRERLSKLWKEWS